MRSEGYSSCFVCVCLSLTTFSHTTHGFSNNKAYQKIQHDMGTILEKASFAKTFSLNLWRNLLTSSSCGILAQFFFHEINFYASFEAYRYFHCKENGLVEDSV